MAFHGRQINRSQDRSNSTLEAEYVALATTVKKIININMMFEELQNSTVIEVPCKPHIIGCDNKSAIDFGYDAGQMQHQ